jgi:hypothetical protein
MPRRAGASPSADPWTVREGLLWGALAVALSACWIDLAEHWRANPWARPSALFLPLLVATALRERRRAPGRAAGWLLVAAGVGLLLFATGGGAPRLGRPGLPLAVVGMALVLGRPSLGVALLAFWVLPPPFALSRLLSPGLEQWLAELGVRALELGGRPAALGSGGIVVDGAVLPLAPTDGGLPLVVYLAGIGWWLAMRRGRDLVRAAFTALRFAPWGLAAQALALGCAIAALASGSAPTARALLDLAPWAALALAIALGMGIPGREMLSPRPAETSR